MNRAAMAIGKFMAVALVAVAAAERVVAQQEKPTEQPAPETVRRMVINIPAMKLDLYENEVLVRSYGVAVGKRSTPSPTGAFRVATQVKNPTWWGPNQQVVKAGPHNPVGTRWIGLDKKGYGIHGTNAPKSIGRAASHGCFRLRNADVEDLFARVKVGDEVQIVYETLLEDGMELTDVYGLAGASKVAQRSTGSQPATTVGGGS